MDHSISICPRGDKRLFLATPDLSRRVPVNSRLYWFNDMDWHGVEPDPFFRYSIRELARSPALALHATRTDTPSFNSAAR